jgi:hypothetical protein
MTITISSFAWVPPFAQGYVKDIRPRWALAEAGLDYNVHLLSEGDADAPDYRRWQPFGQVPAYRDDEVQLFESGAIRHPDQSHFPCAVFAEIPACFAAVACGGFSERRTASA